MKETLFILLLSLFGLLCLYANDSIKPYEDYDHEDVFFYYNEDSSLVYWTDETIDFDTSMMYVPEILLGEKESVHRFKKVIVYAETCIVEEADVVIIKCSDYKPLIILEQKEE
jgi:hypothetical protein